MIPPGAFAVAMAVTYGLTAIGYFYEVCAAAVATINPALAVKGFSYSFFMVFVGQACRQALRSIQG